MTAPAAPLVVPLDIAVQIGRLVLDAADTLDYGTANRGDVAGHVGSLKQALRQVLDALDAEQVTA